MSQRLALRLTVLIITATAVTCAWCFWMAANGPVPPLEVVPPEVNLGHVYLFDDREFSVDLRNDGGEAVEISDIRLDCACTSVKLETARIEPGTKARLSGTYQGPSKPGPFARRLALVIGKPARGHYILPIIGVGARRIRVSPNSVVLRPDVARGRLGVAALCIQNNSDVSVELTLPREFPAGITASIDQTALLPGQSCEVTVNADSELVVESSADLVVGVSHPLEKKLSIPVEVDPVQGATVSPDRIAFGVLSTESLLKKRSVVIALEGALLRQCTVEHVACPKYLEFQSVESSNPTMLRVVLVIVERFEGADLGGTIGISLRHEQPNRVFRATVNVSGFLTDAAAFEETLVQTLKGDRL
jgi:uncharacterized protein DUF1573